MTMLGRIVWSLTGAIAAVAVLATAQAQPQFEVASVRPNLAGDHIVTIQIGPGDRFAARGYTLVLLIQLAYGVMDWNVAGGPGWIRNDRFDVVAKARVTGNLTEAQLQPMLQRLLAERFKLRLHRSSKDMAAYALEIAKFGPKLKAAAGEEHSDTFRMSRTGLSGQGLTTRDLARFVCGKLGLVGVDQTGLTGLYDFQVDWKVETGSTSVEEDRDAFRFAVFAALENQLGLKFTLKKVPVPMLVIDGVERALPSEN